MVQTLVSFDLIARGISKATLPVVASNWWRVDDRPIMSTGNGVYGPGHGSFTTDRNGVPYVVYHANNDATSGWNGRTIRAEPFKWNGDSSPWLPTPPSPPGVQLQLPA